MLNYFNVNILIRLYKYLYPNFTLTLIINILKNVEQFDCTIYFHKQNDQIYSSIVDT